MVIVYHIIIRLLNWLIKVFVGLLKNTRDATLNGLNKVHQLCLVVGPLFVLCCVVLNLSVHHAYVHSRICFQVLDSEFLFFDNLQLIGYLRALFVNKVSESLYFI